MMPKAKLGRPKGGRGVLQVDEHGAMAFDNAEIAAEAMGVSRNRVYQWIWDGKEHAGFWWKWEPANCAEAFKLGIESPPMKGISEAVRKLVDEIGGGIGDLK
jgi:hypothetical protein